MNTPTNNNIEAIYPLTPLQKGMIFHSMLSPNSGAYVLQDTLSIESLLDREAFWQAWQMLMDRHSILRTLFIRMDTDKPLQVVLKTVAITRHELDWTKLSVLDQEKKLELLQKELWTTGFDFSKPPLLKLVLIQVGEADFKIIWTLHHVLTDGWSSQIILKDWFSLYYSLRDKKAIELPTAKPFKEYISWLSKQDSEAARLFWSKYLKEFSIKNELQDNLGASECSSDSSNQIGDYLTEDCSRRLEDYSSNIGITLNILMQGVWAFLLHAYCNSKDICFGVTVSGRPADIKGVEKMAGPFINSVPVRVAINPDENIELWLKDIYKHQVQRVNYEHAPLFDIQKFSDIGAGVSLFDTLVVFDNYPKDSENKYGARGERADSLKIERIGGKSYNHYPLTVMIAPGKRTYISFKYNEQIFSPTVIHKIHQHFISISTQIVEGKALKLSDLRAFSEQDEMISNQLKRTDDPVKEDNFVNVFEGYASNSPDNTALVYRNNSYTYAHLNKRSNQLAHYMARNGAGYSSRVGIFLESPLDIISSIIAIAKIGATFCILDNKWTESRLAYAINRAEFSMVVTEQEKLDSLGEVEINIISLDRDKEEIEAELTSNTIHRPSCKNDFSAYIVFTSGSTGNPKPVLVGHRALQHYVNGLLKKIGFAECKEWAAFASPSADLGYTSIFGALCSGGALRLFDQMDYLDTCSLENSLLNRPIDVLKIVPSHLSALLNNSKGSAILPKELLILGGDTISPLLIKEIKKRSPDLQILNHYGPTETTVGAATYKVSDVAGHFNDIPIGTPLSHRNIYILDKSLNPVGAGVIGDIYIGGEGLAYGYLDGPRDTAEKFLPDISGRVGARMYQTGDRGFYTLDGNVVFKGREDFQIKRNGYRIELGEIESVLLGCEGVCNAVVLVKDEKLHAYIVLTNGIHDLDEVKEYSRTHLVEIMQPNTWFLLEKMPLAVNGKVDRNSLKKMELNSIPSESSEPKNELEKEIMLIWSNLTGNTSIDVNDNFYQSGGNSLLIIRLQGEIKKKFNISLDIVELFGNPTIRSQAKLLGGEKVDSGFDQLNSSFSKKKIARDSRRRNLSENIT